MFTALTLSLALGAPVPAPAPAAPTGPAPRVQELKPAENGKITIAVMRTEMVQAGVAAAGNPPVPGGPRVVRVNKIVTVELGEVKDLTITTADGKKVEKEDAMKKLAAGAVVVVSADGKPVSPAFLKVFKDDTLVLASPELIGLPAGGRPAIGGVRPGPLPAAVPGAVPGAQVLPIQGGGVIQIQIQGGAAPATLPAAPPQPAPAEKKPER